MAWWNDKAANLQAGVRAGELDQYAEYSDEELRRAVAHTREDVVLLVGHLDAVNTQLWTIKLLLVVIAVLMLIVALK